MTIRNNKNSDEVDSEEVDQLLIDRHQCFLQTSVPTLSLRVTTTAALSLRRAVTVSVTVAMHRMRRTVVSSCNTIQYNTIQYNTIQYNTIRYNTLFSYFEHSCNSITPVIVPFVDIVF